MMNKKEKFELIEKANVPNNDFGKSGNPQRLIKLLEKEGYLQEIDWLKNRSFSAKQMSDVIVYYHQSSDKSVLQSVIIKVEEKSFKVLDFNIVDLNKSRI